MAAAWARWLVVAKRETQARHRPCRAAACMAVHAELFQGYGFRQIPKMRGKPESWVMGARGVWILHAHVLRLRLGAHSSDDYQSVQRHEHAQQVSSISGRNGPTTALNVNKRKTKMDESNSRLISETLWDEVKSLQRSGTPTSAAIAYYSRDLLYLKEGDILVCDASFDSISSGKSSGYLLLELHKKGVKIYSQPALHAKVACIGSSVLVGSANASLNSENRLVEAAVLSQDSGLYAQVLSFVNQLATPEALQTTAQLKVLAAIPVLQQKGEPSTPRPPVKIEGTSVAWWLSTGPISEKLNNDLALQREKGLHVAKKLAPEVDTSELDFISWPMRFRVAKEAKPGDRVIQAYASTKRGDDSNCAVNAAAAIVHVERGPAHALIYLKSHLPASAPLELAEVQKVTNAWGRKLTARSARILSEDEYLKIESLFPGKKK